MFNFLEYGEAIERMMKEWYKYTHEILKQSGDLGNVREHFIKQVLAGFLPKSIIVGSGEIVDGSGARSGQQDIIIYRADFPVITSLTPINTFLVEGVIATIEVKSDLSTGQPDLKTAFRSSKGVLSLRKQAAVLRGEVEEVEILKNINRVKTYVVGYSGWEGVSYLVDNYVAAGNEVGWEYRPHLVCQPGACVIRHDGFIVPYAEGSEKGANMLWINTDNPFTVFLHHLLKAIILNTRGAVVSTPDDVAAMIYNLDPYFNFNPPLAFERWRYHLEGNVVAEEDQDP